MVYFQKRIFREDLIKNPNCQFLFGDNLLQMGYGGQAKEMRGEPNAIGIPTKREPNNYFSSYFTDDDYDINIKHIDNAFNKIDRKKIIIVPTDGIGTGLAKLPEKAPKTYRYLLQKLKELEND